MKPFSIDKKTYQILDYIYEHSECTVSSLCKSFCISSIEQSSPLIAALMNLFDNRYISVCNPRLPLSASYSLETYNDACRQHKLHYFLPTALLQYSQMDHFTSRNTELKNKMTKCSAR